MLLTKISSIFTMTFRLFPISIGTCFLIYGISNDLIILKEILSETALKLKVEGIDWLVFIDEDTSIQRSESPY